MAAGARCSYVVPLSLLGTYRRRAGAVTDLARRVDD
jgi:hypothetical protein